MLKQTDKYKYRAGRTQFIKEENGGLKLENTRQIGGTYFTNAMKTLIDFLHAKKWCQFFFYSHPKF